MGVFPAPDGKGMAPASAPPPPPTPHRKGGGGALGPPDGPQGWVSTCSHQPRSFEAGAGVRQSELLNCACVSCCGGCAPGRCRRGPRWGRLQDTRMLRAPPAAEQVSRDLPGRPEPRGMETPASPSQAGPGCSPAQALGDWPEGPSRLHARSVEGPWAAGKRPAGPAQGPAFLWGRFQCLLNPSPFTQVNVRDMEGPRAE